MVKLSVVYNHPADPEAFDALLHEQAARGAGSAGSGGLVRAASVRALRAAVSGQPILAFGLSTIEVP